MLIPNINVTYLHNYADRRHRNYSKTDTYILQKNRISFQAKVPTFTQELYKITNDDKKFSEFAEQVIKNPRKSAETVSKLLKLAGSIKNFLNWYLGENGYKDKYIKFIDNLVNNAQKPEELLKISPNWGIWTLENKFGKDFFIGNIPDDIGSYKTYEKLVKKLLKNEDTGFRVHEFTNGLSGKRTFMLDTGKNKYVLKAQQDFSLYSEKLKSALEQDSWLQDTFINIYKQNENMKSDSSYLNAMLDFYLNLNNCPNGTKIYCFDAKTSSVLYDFIEGSKCSKKLGIKNINQYLPDLKKLGIIYNDIHADNFREQDGILKIIDSGESNFIDLLKPTVPYLQIELPNWSGNNILSILGGLQYLKIFHI